MNLFGLWIGILGAPLVWLAHLELNYSLSAGACRSGQKSALLLGTLIALVLSLAAAFAAWRAWRSTEAATATEQDNPTSRSRFMALAGLGVSALMVLLVTVSFLPIAVLEVCD
jgi:uncharacterized membrane protein YidH (DUF202 family)